MPLRGREEDGTSRNISKSGRSMRRTEGSADAAEAAVLATCSIRPPDKAFENPNHVSCSLPIPNEEEYNRTYTFAHLHKGERTPCRGFSRSSRG